MAKPKSMKTVVALYDSLQSAKRALDQLHGEAIPDECISVVASARGHGKRGTAELEDARRAEESGTAVGVGSMLAGLAALTIPAIGPVLALGPLAAAAAATGVGEAAPAPALAPNLVAAGVPETDARAYLDAVRDGGALVMVLVKPRKLASAAGALSRADPVPLPQWKSGPSQLRVRDRRIDV